jgi:hypothetical protein
MQYCLQVDSKTYGNPIILVIILVRDAAAFGAKTAKLFVRNQRYDHHYTAMAMQQKARNALNGILQ